MLTLLVHAVMMAPACANVNPFMPTVPTFAVRETDVSRQNGGTLGAPLKPLRDDSALSNKYFPTAGVHHAHPGHLAAGARRDDGACLRQRLLPDAAPGGGGAHLPQ